MKAYTDYPFEFLGDEPYKTAPIRECTVVNYDGNKYCDILVEGRKANIKAGYIYQKHGRLGEVPAVDEKALPRKELNHVD